MSDQDNIDTKVILFLIFICCFATGLGTRQYQINLYSPLIEACELPLERTKHCELIAVPATQHDEVKGDE